MVLLALSAGGTYAFPGMRQLMVDLMKRQAPPNIPEPLIGDLATKGATTPVGTAVLNCINGTAACQNLDPKVYVNHQKRNIYMLTIAIDLDIYTSWKSG